MSQKVRHVLLSIAILACISAGGCTSGGALFGISETEARIACTEARDYILREESGISLAPDLSGVVLQFDPRLISSIEKLSQGGDLPEGITDYANRVVAYMEPIDWSLPPQNPGNVSPVISDIGTLRGRCEAFLLSTPSTADQLDVLEDATAAIWSLVPKTFGEVMGMLSVISGLWVLFVGFAWNNGRAATQQERVVMWAALMAIAWVARTFL